MRKIQCVSITELRTKTAACLKDLQKTPKYIFMNNKPVAVLMSVEEFEEHNIVPRLIEVPEHEITPEIREALEKAKKIPLEDCYNLTYDAHPRYNRKS